MAEHLKEGLSDRAPAVDVIAGPDSYRRMPELLAAARREHAHPLVDVKLDKAETYEGLSGAIGGDGISGFVTIQRGCDKFCTFCVVPFTRGRERGAAPREILRQVRELVAAGYREVTLLGQTVNSYRWPDEAGGEVTFGELLRAVARIDGLERIRFTSPYPVDFTADVIAAIAEEPKVCKYVHLPVQSGSDVVLERMRRGYTVADYRAIVGALRAAMPDIALSTDILTGFSGETEDDHQQTLALMREVRFDAAFMFAYSERDLTFAAKKLPDDVPEATKKRRLAEIVALQEKISAEVFAAQIGRRERVLVHGPSKRDPAQLIGRTDGFKSVILPAGVGAIGELVDVTIERATMATLFGRE
jgi:tRNA-2-methylthio-N6-dimethylallyladenosine synthase